MDAEDLLSKVVVAVLIIAAVVFDWPRALGGALVGLAAWRVGWPYVTIPVGVAVIAGLGELIYRAMGYADALSWPSFWTGIVAAGVGAIGLARLTRWIVNDVEAPE